MTISLNALETAISNRTGVYYPGDYELDAIEITSRMSDIVLALAALRDALTTDFKSAGVSDSIAQEYQLSALDDFVRSVKSAADGVEL